MFSNIKKMLFGFVDCWKYKMNGFYVKVIILFAWKMWRKIELSDVC